jgi:hypothetical protein
LRVGTFAARHRHPSENVLHSSGEGADGSSPSASMTYEGESLVGTSYLGAYGYGTAFSLAPEPSP